MLDGGLSNQLEAAGHDLSDELWSARLLTDAPDAIAEAHAAYFAAGAQVATTSSYQASFEGFARKGIGRERAAQLMRSSVELARRAATIPATVRAPSADEDPQRPAPPRRWVAASVGPYGAVLADGSEYRGRYGLSVAELERFHRPRVEALAAASPDVFAFETVPDLDEAAALLRIAGSLGLPCWLSYTIDGERTRAGQPLDEAFGLAAESDAVIAAGVNCCAPGDVAHAVKVAALVTGKPAVAYPNSGELWDGGTRSWQGTNSFDAALVRSWVAAGARLVGGCCRVGPAAIAAVRATLDTAFRSP